MTFDMAAVRVEVERLRLADPDFRVFGAIGHRYEFRVKASAQTLVQFEGRHRISLPSDYRAYLAWLGNGGAGPFYGIFPHGLFDGAGDEEVAWSEDDGIVGVLAEPFPHQGAWNLGAERLSSPESFKTDEEEAAWFDALDAEYWRPGLVNGAFPICHHGCALRTYLVVSGPEYGHVWLDARAEYGGLRPHLDAAGRHMTFAAWYTRWIQESRRECDQPR